MNTFWIAQLRKDFLWAYSYKLSFYMQFIGIVISVYTLFFISKTFELSESPHLENYGKNYFLFAIIGLGVLDFINLSMRSATKTVRDAQAFGYSDIIFHAQISPGKVLLASLIYPSCIGLVRLCVYLGLAILFQDFDFSLYSLTLSILINVLILIPFVGLSLLAASFVIVYKQGEPINYIAGMTFFLFSGVLFPTSVLPSFLQEISQVIPATHGLDIVRKIIIENSYESLSFFSILYLLSSSFIMLFLGFVSVNKAVNRMKITGGIGEY